MNADERRLKEKVLSVCAGRFNAYGQRWFEGILKPAQCLVAEGPIPRKATGDALHIAIATVYACEYLLTWNCRHIANAEIQREVRRVVSKQGFELPILCTPEELMGEQQ